MRHTKIVATLGPASREPQVLDALIAAGATVQTPIEPLSVYVLYWTVIAAEDGSIGFRRDLYRRDSRLNAALRQRFAAATPAGAIGGCPYEG